MITPASDWFRQHAITLRTLDPLAPLDDLEPLRKMVADAQVVAIGESAHFVHEFTCLRQRILRFLNECCGFSVFAFEFGFSEGFAIDDWVGASEMDVDLAKISETAAAWGARELLEYIRKYNTTAVRPLRFAGIDIPEAGGSLVPALAPIAKYLRQVDPEVVHLVEHAIEIASRFAGKSGASAAPAWAKLDPSEQNGLTAALARLSLRFRALEPLYVSRSDKNRYDTALWRLEAAIRTDYILRAMTRLFAGTPLPGDLSVRDM